MTSLTFFSLTSLHAAAIKPDPIEGGGTGGNAAASPGPAYSWVGSVDDVNTGIGNKLTTLEIVSWGQRGGLPVDFTLYHNSQSMANSELGPKWLTSYDCRLSVNSTTGTVTAYWGDGRVCTFAKTASNSYTSPAGVFDTLSASYSGTQITGFSLVTKPQTRFSYSAAGRLGSVADENGNAVTLGYLSGTNLVQTITDASGRTLTLGYTSSKLTSVTDPLSHQWTLSYDGGGNLARINWPVVGGAASSVNVGYDSGHNITSYQDKRANTAYFTYNTDNSLATEKDNAGNLTSFSYGAAATTITDANSHTTVHTYNASGQLASVTDALGYVEYYSYDAANNLTQKKDRSGQLWNYTFDGMGNTLTAKDPLSHTTTYTYNAHSKPLTHIWPSGRSVANTYDAADNLVQLQEKDAAGNVKATTTLTIGTYGLVASKTDANSHKTLYTYDANGYLNSTTTPMGHQTKWTYDALGFQTSRTDAMGRTTTYTPDAWERNTKTSYPDGTANTYGYDQNSNLTAFANYAASFTRTYDADNRLLGEAFSGIRHFSHSYDAAEQKGLLSTVTDYDGRVISYAYSARNELASVGDSTGTTSYTYDANGRQSHLNNPNGTRTDQYYNADGSLDGYYDWNGASTIFASFGYAYNADSQITSENEGTSGSVHTAPNPTQTAYGYDAQGHLTSEVRTGTGPLTHNYGFDPAGNRTLFYDGNTSPQTYDADDEPTGCGGPNTFVLGYNLNGDRISETINGSLTTTFGYDFDDQLTSVTKSGTSVSYAYDAIGRQLSKNVSGALTIYYFDGNQVVEEKTTGGTLLAQYLWGNGLIRCNGEYPLTDGRVNIRLSTNATQQVTSTNQPDAFGIGSVTANTASAYSYGGAVGYRQDGIAAAGLPSAYAFQKVGARYYDPTFGCFLTRDTDLSEAAFAYCNGDPVNFNDPTGHKSKLSTTLSAIGLQIKNAGGATYRFGRGVTLMGLGIVTVGVLFKSPTIVGVGSVVSVTGIGLVIDGLAEYGVGVGLRKIAPYF